MYYENKILYGNYDCLETHYMQDIPFNVDDVYYKVPHNLENRLDTISYNFYGDVSLWWVIAQASNIKNPLDVPKGTVLRIPPLSTLFYVRGTGLEGS